MYSPPKMMFGPFELARSPHTAAGETIYIGQFVCRGGDIAIIGAHKGMPWNQVILKILPYTETQEPNFYKSELMATFDHFREASTVSQLANFGPANSRICRSLVKRDKGTLVLCPSDKAVRNTPVRRRGLCPVIR